MLKRSTIQLLRFHFSFFLLPVYLFALSQVSVINWTKALVVFIILHILVYPASNGYNSYMDRDDTPIGGLQNPMQPTRQLFVCTMVMDLIAIVMSLFVGAAFAAGVVVYIIASRAYSYRGIRLKKYPVIGFLTVFIMQGALIFYITFVSSAGNTSIAPLLPCLIASLLIGALYPLTQVYQHEADKKDDVITISYLLGKRGSFVFSMLLFLTATALIYVLFNNAGQLNYFFLYTAMLFPVAGFFVYWMVKVWQNEAAASFSNSFKMNLIATCCTSLFFLTLIILTH
jgi:1,4-dihydroxy-2-naphthoate polyprenyltransferase